MSVHKRATVAVAAGVLVALVGFQQVRARNAAPKDLPASPGVRMVPYFEWDETFPKMPLPNNGTTGTVVGVAIDKREHVWIALLGLSLGV